MAEKLLGSHVTQGETSSVEAVELFKNGSSGIADIRAISLAAYLTNNSTSAGVVEYQFSRQASYQDTDLGTGKKFSAICAAQEQSVTSTGVVNKKEYYAKGQFPLGPGETLYYNSTVSGTIDGHKAIIDVDYHFRT